MKNVIPVQLHSVIDAIVQEGGLPFLVGGAVRDHLLDIAPKDFDFEVSGLPLNRLTDVLKRFGQVKEVGVSFGIILLERDGLSVEFAIPRREVKIGELHTDFRVELDPSMSIEKALARRDFTCNAMAIDHEGNLLDPFYGKEDMENGQLRHVGPSFSEDPLRVLRAVQFCARFGWTLNTDTAQLCDSLKDQFNTLSKERVFEEFRKLFIKGEHPIHGLECLQKTGWLEVVAPELAALVNVQQSPEWHPEGPTFRHTGFVCDAAAMIADREQLNEEDRLILMLAALCHDLGKATTTRWNADKQRWTAYGHEAASVPLARQLLERIGCWPGLVEPILELVGHHMPRPAEWISAKNVRKLSVALKHSNIRSLLRVMEADNSGRPPLPAGKTESMLKIERIANDEGVMDGPPKPVVMGRDLVEIGLPPGPRFGKILGEAFTLQIAGRLDKEKFLNKLKIKN